MSNFINGGHDITLITFFGCGVPFAVSIDNGFKSIHLFIKANMARLVIMIFFSLMHFENPYFNY